MIDATGPIVHFPLLVIGLVLAMFMSPWWFGALIAALAVVLIFIEGDE